MAALFTTAKNWQQPSCSSRGERMKKLRKNISINETIWKKLQEFAKKENRSASNFIEYLIEKWEKGE